MLSCDRNGLSYRTYSYILSACITAGYTNGPVVSGVVTEMAYHTGSASRTVLNVAVYSSASINPLCVAGDGDNNITVYWSLCINPFRVADDSDTCMTVH